MATFHSVSLALRRKDPEMFREKISPYLNLFSGDDDEMKDFLRAILVVFDHIPSCKHLLERINKSMDSAAQYDKSYREPWATIIHHDFWCNNIMVTEEQPPRVTILDLQTTTLGSPAIDVIFLLLTSVKLEDIENRLDYFLQYYYDQFTAQLKSLGIDIVEFSYENFVKEIDTVSKLGQYIHALGHTSVILGEKGHTSLDSSDANYNMDAIDTGFKVNDKHIRKFEWITLEAEKRNWI
ncbi:hypothetical protein GWI33_009668 [Rhynchophorus ferrugineus]|uniref:CHK kinase-like domain-containing protein n=1 Tax=Rhynchophorus ferrugineus TaxID=354439 RepID=A0A834IBV5_RHYFE|nr:hypothetical protein GWI33_009668 [Rhynchophorus ferrugineus]